jgi:hypothetical protein
MAPRCSAVSTRRTVWLTSPYASGVAQGRDAIERGYQAFFTSFSSSEFRPEQLLIDGDKGAALVRVHETKRGGVMGCLPPNGHSASCWSRSATCGRDSSVGSSAFPISPDNCCKSEHQVKTCRI